MATHDHSVLAHLRKQAGYKRQVDLGDEIGVSQGFISDLESGEKEIPPARIADLADAFDMDPDILHDRLYESGEPHFNTNAWQIAVLSSPSLDPVVKVIIALFPDFLRHDIVLVTAEEAAARASMDLKVVQEVWDQVTSSEFVEPVKGKNYAFELRMPE